jgi:putative ABC transport system substrate-binding protein
VLCGSWDGSKAKNVAFEGRYADNRLERLPALAGELVRLNVDVIVAIGTLAPLAAKRATSTIPIVMTAARRQATRIA